MSARTKAIYLACFAVSLMGLGAATPAHAQSCTAQDDDAGLCEDDAGTLASAALAGDASDIGAGAACSCTSDFASGSQGRIHLCTGSGDQNACAEMSCERGKLRAVECAQSYAQLCCQVPSREVYVQLYQDCDHPNCMAGFLSQCEDLGGEVLVGSCKKPMGTYDGYSSYRDDSGSDCSVLHVGARSSHAALVTFAVLALGLTVRRRRGYAKQR